MDKIKHYLKDVDTKPLTRLLVQENKQTKILIQKVIINQNIKPFSEAENTPLGQGTFLHNAIGSHETSEFCDRVLDGEFSKVDKEDINYVEAYELLQHMHRKK